MVEKKIIIEKEHFDPNLIIKKTKIYLLNTDNPFVKKVIQDEQINELKKRYGKLEEI
jgi:hypothetical protein